ncbi:MAG: 3-mercaptopyruvate sulfurtransferase [Caulobacteraceae bacterium]
MSGPLVSTAWLADRLAREDVVILDATWFMPPSPRRASDEHARGHIPGAAFFDIDEVVDRKSGLPHMLASPADFARAARRLGVNAGSSVIVYDALGLFSAPRAWWSFRVMGHDRSFVVAGGLPKWVAEGRATETGRCVPAPGNFEADFRPELVRDLAAVKVALATGREQIVDARPAARFHGEAPEPRPGLRSGHMPGALNVPFSELVGDLGELRPLDALRDAFEAGGVDLSRPITASCGSGVSAALLALALFQLGRPDAAVYDGSWAEWGASADTSVIVGDR